MCSSSQHNSFGRRTKLHSGKNTLNKKGAGKNYGNHISGERPHPSRFHP